LATANGNKTGLTQLAKAKIYNQIKRRLGYAEFVLGLGYVLVLLVSGWTFDLRNLSLKVGGGPVVWVVIYFVLALFLYELLTLPLGVLSGYFLERRFGLLNQSARAWAWDYLKAQGLSLVLGILSVEFLYFFLRWAGPWWWLPAGTAFALLFVILAQLTPVVILPLFFKFKPLPESDLTRRLAELCRRAGARVLGIYEWGLSAQTRRANAALVGWGATRRVVLSDTLLKNFTPSEIEIVLAHELGHFRLGHLSKLLLVQTGATFIAFAVAGLVFRGLGPWFGLTHIADPAGMPLLVLAFIGAGLAGLPVINMISRYLERQADYFALSLTGLIGSFISAMEHLAALNLAEMDPHPVIEFLFHGHPSPARRIQAAKNYMRLEMDQDG